MCSCSQEALSNDIRGWINWVKHNWPLTSTVFVHNLLVSPVLPRLVVTKEKQPQSEYIYLWKRLWTMRNSGESFWPLLSKMMSTHLKLTCHSKGTKNLQLRFFLFSLPNWPHILWFAALTLHCGNAVSPKSNQKWLFLKLWNSHDLSEHLQMHVLLVGDARS